MKKIHLFGILFLALVLVAGSVSVSAANCVFYYSCWDKASGGNCCKTVAVCDTGTSSVTHCTDSGVSITPPDNFPDEKFWNPPIGHVDHGKEIQIPVETPIEKLIESLTRFGAGTEYAKTVRKTGSQGDYFPMADFKLEIDGVIAGGFKEISGIESETEIIEIKDGDDMTIRKRPGRTKFSNIVLTQGFVNDPAFLKWYKIVERNMAE